MLASIQERRDDGARRDLPLLTRSGTAASRAVWAVTVSSIWNTLSPPASARRPVFPNSEMPNLRVPVSDVTVEPLRFEAKGTNRLVTGFEITEEVDSFVIQAFGNCKYGISAAKAPESRTRPLVFELPQNYNKSKLFYAQNKLEQNSGSDGITKWRLESQSGIASIQAPMPFQKNDLTGSWRAEIYCDPAQCQPNAFIVRRKVLRKGEYGYVLNVNLYSSLISGGYQDKLGFIIRGMEVARSILKSQPCNIDLRWDYVDDLEYNLPYFETSFENETGLFFQDKFESEKLTLLVAQDLIVSHLNESGISGAILGPLVTHPRCGVIVELRTDFFDDLKFGKLISHEICHYLGLTHESYKYINGGETMDDDAENRRNIMFSKGRGITITEAQAFVMRASPLVQLEAELPPPPAPLPPPKSLIHSLKVTIHTGWGWPRVFDGGGTDMTVFFSLLDGDPVQSWNLSSMKHGPFWAGGHDEFSLDVRGVNIDNISRWGIVARNTVADPQSIDTWHLYYVKITSISTMGEFVMYENYPNAYIGGGYPNGFVGQIVHQGQ